MCWFIAFILLSVEPMLSVQQHKSHEPRGMLLNFFICVKQAALARQGCTSHRARPCHALPRRYLTASLSALGRHARIQRGSLTLHCAPRASQPAWLLYFEAGVLLPYVVPGMKTGPGELSGIHVQAPYVNFLAHLKYGKWWPS